jgi:putative DNA primase/helicase
MDYTMKCAAVSPAETEDCPLWFAFLDTVLAGDAELGGYLQRVFGYALTGQTTEHALFFLYGTGRNGKGVFLDTMRGILGNYAAVAATETFISTRNERHSTELAALHGARLVIANETDEGRAWNEARVKTLTGGDPITARFMRMDDFTFTPRLKLAMSGNHKPSLRSVDPAMRSRIHLIPFMVFIPAEKRDLDLKDKLRAEWPGILRWMINGCLSWRRNRLSPPKAVVNATEEYFEGEDTMAQWLDEECEEKAGWFSPTIQLYTAWAKWAKDRGHWVINEKQFIGRMGRFPHERRLVDKKRHQGFVGVKLRYMPGSESPR